MRRRLLALVLLSACSKPAPPPYVRSHVDADPAEPCLYWPNRSLTWRLDPRLSARTPGETERTAVEASIASWQAVASSCSNLTFTQSDAGSNLIVWRETSCAGVVPASHVCHGRGDCGETFGCWDDTPDALAVTTVTYLRSTGHLLKADVVLNGASWLFTTVDAPPCEKDRPAVDCVATDVQNTVTHEIGHLLGFDHTTAPGSTMATSAPPGETSKRVIDDGTREGFCAVYPLDAPTPACDGGT